MSFRAPERSETITRLKQLSSTISAAASLGAKLSHEQMVQLRDLIPGLEKQLLDILGDAYTPKATSLPVITNSDSKLTTGEKDLIRCRQHFLGE